MQRSVCGVVESNRHHGRQSYGTGETHPPSFGWGTPMTLSPQKWRSGDLELLRAFPFFFNRQIPFICMSILLDQLYMYCWLLSEQKCILASAVQTQNALKSKYLKLWNLVAHVFDLPVLYMVFVQICCMRTPTISRWFTKTRENRKRQHDSSLPMTRAAIASRILCSRRNQGFWLGVRVPWQYLQVGSKWLTLSLSPKMVGSAVFDGCVHRLRIRDLPF